MNTKGEHLEYLSHKGRFTIDCNHEIFSAEEILVLEKWGHWFTALASGDLKPFTVAQERFIKAMNKEVEVTTIYEKAWFKYLGRKLVEKKYGDKLKIKYEAEENTWYSWEDKKKLDRIMMSTVWENHIKDLSD